MFLKNTWLEKILLPGWTGRRLLIYLIRIGLNEKQKQNEIMTYVKNNSIKNVIVFSPEKIFMELPELEVPIRQIGYKEIIMYRTFFPLLEEIDKDYLLVANELMRDVNRNCLTYNCYAKYTNQTLHRIVFNFHPIISSSKDIMILVDFDNSQKNKGLGLADISLGGYDIQCVQKKYNLNVLKIPLPEGAVKEYEEEKERLFDSLGNKNPDTIPRNLHIWTGKYKAVFINDTEFYIARNQRFKKPNVSVFKNAEAGRHYTLLDFPVRQIELNDFLRTTEQENLKYMSTGLNIDNVYTSTFNNWIKEVENIYAETGIYKR